MTSNNETTSTILPATLPKKCRDIFAKLASPLPEEALPELRDEMRFHMLAAERHLGPAPLNLPLIERMTAALETALKSYGSLPEVHRAFLVGAIRYFKENDDASNDLEDPLGFDDDLAVINSVLMEIGLSHLVVSR